MNRKASTALTAAAALLGSVFAARAVLRLITVEGASMEPALTEGTGCCACGCPRRSAATCCTAPACCAAARWWSPADRSAPRPTPTTPRCWRSSD
ncbi:hypothetical protein [Streptacidiphilus sp. PAMC 29251]